MSDYCRRQCAIVHARRSIAELKLGAAEMYTVSAPEYKRDLGIPNISVVCRICLKIGRLDLWDVGYVRHVVRHHIGREKNGRVGRG